MRLHEAIQIIKDSSQYSFAHTKIERTIDGTILSIIFRPTEDNADFIVDCGYDEWLGLARYSTNLTLGDLLSDYWVVV